MLKDFNTQTIKWDKATDRINEVVRANSGDSNGRRLRVQVLNNGEVEDLTGASLSLAWKTKDKKHKGLDAFTAVDASTGVFEIAYTTGMLSNVGKLSASLVLTTSGGVTESSSFVLFVERSNVDDDSVQSSDSYTALTKAMVSISGLATSVENKVDKNGAGQVGWANLAQDAREQISGNKVAVVGKDSVGSENLSDNSVTSKKYADNSIARIKSATSLGGMQDGIYFANDNHVITRVGTDIKVKFRSGAGYYKNVERRDAISLTTLEYTVPHNFSLVYTSTDQNKFYVKETDSLTIEDYILCSNHNGVAKINNLKRRVYFNDILFTTAITKTRTVGNKVEITFAGDKRLFLKTGDLNTSEMFNISQEVYLVPHSHALVFDRYVQTLVIRQWDVLAPSDVVLFGNTQGKIVQDNIGAGKSLPPLDTWKIHGNELSVKVPSVMVGQGITEVGDYLVVFDESRDDHSNYGVYYVLDRNTFEMISNNNHNFGHVNSIDYNKDTDQLIIGNNAGEGQEIPPAVTIINNALQLFSNGGRLEWDNLDKVTIDLFTQENELGNYGVSARPNACWGESNNIIYVVMNDNNVIYRCYLGKGEHNLTNLGAYGYTTFGNFSAVSSDKLNGTLRVLGEYNVANSFGVNQGIAYHDGKILTSTTHSEILTLAYELTNKKTAILTKTYYYEELDGIGNKVPYEPQGICVIDNKLIQSYKGVAGSGFIKTPV